MKKFRRSTKSSDKADLALRFNPATLSIPQKDAIAIIPPKKVIKALYSYQVQDPEQDPGYLSFEKGDFLHVVGREDDPDWYEACNPLKKSRGLVPVNYFTLVDKRVTRDSKTDASPFPLDITQSNTSVNSDFSSMQTKSITPVITPARTSTSTGGTPIYGIVLYDFQPERADELQANQGDYIIVIAQSNPEWFVAKPITKLGGPGLVPVSFVQIHDTVTGKPAENPLEAIKRAGIPTVEEWKRMAAEYKNSSISLGKISSGTSSQQLASGMDRMSLNGRAGQDPPLSVSEDPRMQQSNGGSYPRTPTQYSYQQTPQPMSSPTRARVLGYFQRNGEFYFTVEALMQDEQAWNLERTYKDFFGLQLHLIEQFPEEAGKREGIPRTLPKMPGPLPTISEKLTSERCRYLDAYLRQLLRINQNINNSHVVRGFFYPREGDRQVTPSDDLLHGDRFSDVSHNSMLGESQENLSNKVNGYNNPQQQYQQQPQFQQQSTPPSQQQQQQPQPQQQQQQPQQQQQQSYPSNNQQFQNQPSQNHYRSPSELRALNGNNVPPPMLRNDSALTATSAASSQIYMGGSNGIGPHAEKIKVWFGESNCVVIRLPTGYNYSDLVMKLRERWSLEPGVDKSSAQEIGFDIEYKDEQTLAYYRIVSDEELSIARDRNEKLTLRVGPVSAMM